MLFLVDVVNSWYVDNVSKRQFIKGYNYASGELLASDIPSRLVCRSGLLKKVAIAKTFDTYTQFDRGIESAVKDYDNLEKHLTAEYGGN